MCQHLCYPSHNYEKLNLYAENGINIQSENQIITQNANINGKKYIKMTSKSYNQNDIAIYEEKYFQEGCRKQKFKVVVDIGRTQVSSE